MSEALHRFGELLQSQRDQIGEGAGYIREPRLQVLESSESIGDPFRADEPLHLRVLISDLGSTARMICRGRMRFAKPMSDTRLQAFRLGL